MQAFVDRFRAKASKARQAQSRMKALARLETGRDRQQPSRRRTLRFPSRPQLSPPLISLERASVGYAPRKPVLSRLDLRLDPDDRIALLGANGNGKTTFARLLAGRLAPLGGTDGAFAKAELRLLRPASDRGDAAGRIGLSIISSALMPDSSARDGAHPARRVRVRRGQGVCPGCASCRAASGRGSTLRS